ncbi:DUF2357 domain-containing protein [Spirochaeta africana]|uniref:DUF2357 domain-containing protein n=1 Tax=Spirochaeta africana (strain ATCC 700263 / DSM 8902 / Z-7692) TaxID=889378 RepID=H9UHH5_SPIAZ|nr:DUF2357 domain-containing protein [Spirochaeta africana]AFG36968.1 hypothetical protein Spiaf_0877 [Spirochaeta africana DSM 8902]
MSNVVLRCGPITVHSSKAAERYTAAKTALFGNDEASKLHTARYSFRGIHANKLELFEDTPVELTQPDEPAGAYSAHELKPVFFDQTPYMFSVALPEAENAYLFTPLADLADSAVWEPDLKRLQVPLNFGNDLGEFHLCWEWITSDGSRHNGEFIAQVYSTKLDIHSHFQTMLEDVQKSFDWIRLDLLRRTSWGWEHDDSASADVQTWLAVFQQVRADMEERLWKLVKQHRRRLVPEQYTIRPERIRCMRPRQEERVFAGMQDNPSKRYRIERKVLDADTPENRYMKYILSHSLKTLRHVCDVLEPMPRVSAVFKQRLQEWDRDWSVLQQHRFWRGIGPFRGLRKESLVLSQDPLYAGIRRSWFLLQYGMQLLERDLRGGIQNVAQLYEVWCLVQLDEIVKRAGWVRDSHDTRINLGPDELPLFSSIDEISSGTHVLEYYPEGQNSEDYIAKLSLLFQPRIDDKPRNTYWPGAMSVPVTQQPDIVLRLERSDLAGCPVYTWIFDAKYRLSDRQDAPDDAVNQLHRYRDAILWSNPGIQSVSISRESIGGYVLYPGTEQANPQRSAQLASIATSNIGAYPLRPNCSQELLAQSIRGRLQMYTGQPDQWAGRPENLPSQRQSKSIVSARLLIDLDQVGGNPPENPYVFIPLQKLVVGEYQPASWDFVSFADSDTCFRVVQSIQVPFDTAQALCQQARQKFPPSLSQASGGDILTLVLAAAENQGAEQGGVQITVDCN